MKLYQYIIVAAMLMMTAACGKKAAEGPQATTEQIEQAHLAGREAARVFVNRTFRDTLEMQEQLIEASAQAARFDSIAGLRAAYDSAFISTVRTVRPEVAAELERYQKQRKQ